MKKTNVTLEAITAQLVQVFSNAAMMQDYNANHGAMYEGVCGWCGIMSPLNRTAFVEAFGEEVTAKAEAGARQQLHQKANEYANTHHAAHHREAVEHQDKNPNAAPVAGGFVFAIHSGMKCDDGRGVFGELREMARDAYNRTKAEEAGERVDEPRRPDLCKVEKVYKVTAEEFNRPTLADELVKEAADKGEEFPGGARNEDEEYRDPVDNYRTWYTLTAAVVCEELGRWYLINSEGYSYARYCLVPTTWAVMYADCVGVAFECFEAEEKKQAEEEAAAKAERAQKYAKRCEKWGKLMQDVRPLVEAEDTAARVHGFRSKEYKAAGRELLKARKGNISAMVRQAFPSLKFSLKKHDGWGWSWELTYQNGPTEEDFFAALDLDLFREGRDSFNGWDDSTEFLAEEFTEFARKYMGMSYGGEVRVYREEVDEPEPQEEQEEPQAETTTANATEATGGTVTLSEYSAKAYALKGETKPYKEALKKFAIWHKGAGAWLISKKRKADAVALLGAALVVLA